MSSEARVSRCVVKINFFYGEPENLVWFSLGDWQVNVLNKTLTRFRVPFVLLDKGFIPDLTLDD